MGWLFHCALALALFSPSVLGFGVKETILPPKNWVKHSLPPADAVISLKIGLAQSNFDALEQHLFEISDPNHPRYGNHLSKEQVDELVAPHPETLTLVDKWLASHGIDLTGNQAVRSSAADWVTVTIPLRLAETMLNTTYYVWKHVASDEYTVRTTSYSLPEHLHAHIDVVQPTTLFSRFQKHKSTLLQSGASFGLASAALEPLVDANCHYAITLKCIQQLYNATGYAPSPDVRNSIGVTGYLEYFANIQDLQLFYKDQLPAAVNSSFNFISVNGGQNPQNQSQAGDEADLDVQFAFGLAYPINSTFYSTSGSPPFNPDNFATVNTNEPYTTWLDFVSKQPDSQVPLAISTSYGDDEQTVPKDYATRACRGFAQLGARGVSLIFSSGDNGVGDGTLDPEFQVCQSNDGTNKTRFLPTFPASCPYVTSVGGTILTVNPSQPETAADLSGGGFSDYFPRPKYQDAAVKKFLSALPNGTYEGLFNPDGRGFPDVSAISSSFRYFWRGGVSSGVGTSAAAPAFTGLVALLNDARLRAGKKPLGFLNPLLYSEGFASGFNDIVTGNAPGCGTEGFNATNGWDPVSGLGTPNFGILKSIVEGY